MTLKIQNKRSSTVNDVPTTAQLDYGEIGVNYNENSPALYIKDNANNIVKIAGEGSFDDYWEKDGDDLYPADNDANILIGGTLPDSPDIKLSSDGNIECRNNAAGLLTFVAYSQFGIVQATRFDTDYTVYLNNSFSGPGGQVVYPFALTSDYQDPGANLKLLIEEAGTVKIGGTLPASPNINLNADGSAEFSDGRFAVSSNGNLSIKSSNSTEIFAVNADVGNVQSVRLATGYSVYLNNLYNGVNYPILLAETGGAASNFKLLIEEEGNIKIGGTLPASPNITLNADGSSLFKGQMELEGVGGDYVFRVTSDTTARYAIRADGTTLIGGTWPASPNIKFGVDGTGEFTGQLTIPEVPDAPTSAASKAYVDSQAVDDTWTQTANVLRPTTAATTVELSSTVPDDTATITVAQGADANFRTQYRRIDSDNSIDSIASTTGLWYDDTPSGGIDEYPIVTIDYLRGGGNEGPGSIVFNRATDYTGSFYRDGSLRIGGTIAAPNISLNPDGTVKARGEITAEQDPGEAGGNGFLATCAGAASDSNAAYLQLYDGGAMWSTTGGEGIYVGAADRSSRWASFSSSSLMIGGTLTSAPNITLNIDGSAQYQGVLTAQALVSSTDQVSAVVQLTNNEGSYNLESTVGDFRLYANTGSVGEKLRVTNDGNVLIGGTLPAAPLFEFNVATGDLISNSPGEGIILTSGNNLKWRLRVTNAGDLIVLQV